MKKIISAALALALLIVSGTAAFALEEEIAEVRWETYDSLIADSGIAAAFHSLGDTGVRIWVPDVFKSIEITDEYAAQGVVSAFSLDDASGFIEVLLLEGGENATIQTTYADMKEENLLPKLADVNGMDAVTCMIPDTDVYSLMVMFEPGRFLQFLFYPMSNSKMGSLVSIVAASIQKEGLVPSPARQTAGSEILAFTWDEAKERARTADPDGRLTQLGDLQVCMWTPNTFLSYALPEDNKDALAWLATADGTASVAISKYSGEGVSMETLQQGLIQYGYDDASLIYINGIPSLSYSDTARDTMNIICRIPGTDDVLSFAFKPISNEDFASLADLMVSSIQVFQAAEP